MTSALDQVLTDLERATTAAIALARQLAAARKDDDEWTRFPPASGRCPISGFSRSKIKNLSSAGVIRRKTVGSSAFYSGADMRRHIAQPCTAPPQPSKRPTTGPSAPIPTGSSTP